MLRIILVMILFAFVKCKKEQTVSNELVGKWIRVEQYVSPGSGGSWVPTNDNPLITLEFSGDGRVYSNHNLYATFSTYTKIGTDSIQFANSAGQKRYHFYSFDNNKLTIRFTCIEGCGDRFVRK